MAKALDVKEFKPRDARDDLIRGLDHAPAEHAEAVLAAYKLLQKLYERGVLDLCTGVLSAGDEITDKLADAVSSREAITGLRLALMLGNLILSVDPEKVHTALSSGQQGKTPSMVYVVRQGLSKDSRRAMAAAVGLLNVLGAALNAPR